MTAQKEAKFVEFPRPLDEEDLPKITTTLRFDPDLLGLLDKAAKKRGISRTAYAMIAISKAIEDGL